MLVARRKGVSERAILNHPNQARSVELTQTIGLDEYI
jgi:hypothetical protein